MTQDLKDKVVLVTGASRGIGYQAAKEIAQRGAHVVATARTVGGLEDLDDEIQGAGGSATLVPLDLRDGDGIDRLGAAIFERWGRLDGLVGNAGLLGTVSPLPHIKVKEFDQVMSLNVTANYRLLRSFDLPLRQSEAGRAVFISSGVVPRAIPYWGPYTMSKAALEAMVKVYAAEMAGTKVRVNILNPGPLRTALRAKGRPGEDPETLRPPTVVAPDIARMLSPDYAENGALFDFTTGETTPLAQKPYTGG
jgi:NAD(P)-dependent dehydrogenase (short-subunit alcohol dehydrogenase family)